MDEIDVDVRFMDFLNNDSTRRLIKRIASSLARSFPVVPDESNESDIDDLEQMICECLLEKREIWSGILSMPSPGFYIRKIVLNHLRSKKRSRNARSPVQYFRKRIIDSLHRSDELHVYSARKGVMCYTGILSGEVPPCYLAPDDIRNVPFDPRFTEPGIDEVKKETRMIEMASAFLEYWSKTEQKTVSLKVDDLLEWIVGQVDILAVFDEAGHYDYSEGDGEDVEQRVSIDGDLANCDPHFEEILKRITLSLSERERRCLRMRYDNKTLEEIAIAVGLKTPSGVSETVRKAGEKIVREIRATGYSVNTDYETILGIIMRFC